jgi:hypothetical protein
LAISPTAHDAPGPGAIVSAVPPASLSNGKIVSHTGTISSVPGFPTATLNFRVSSALVTSNTASFTVVFSNPTSSTIPLVVCSMLDLNKGNVPHPKYKIFKNAAAQWECAAVGMTSSFPSYHFGCERISIPAGPGGIFTITKVATFTNTFKPEDLGTYYFDVLKDCPVHPSCDVFKEKADQWLYPEDPAGHPDWANGWADQRSFQPLALGGVSEGQNPTGNWVTMNYTGPYPSELVATVSGAPAGTAIELTLAGQPSRLYVVPPDPGGPVCSGLEVSIREEFTITGEMTRDSVRLTLPETQCGLIADGALARFRGVVSARPGALYYTPGQFMYSIDHLFINDTRPPLIQAVDAQPLLAGGLRVEVVGTDETTTAAGAAFVYSTEAGGTISLPLQVVTADIAGTFTVFSDIFFGLPTGMPISYQVEVVDDLGNRALSLAQTVTLPPAGPLYLPLAAK